MINLKIGGISLLAGAVLFVLSGTLFGDSVVGAYAVFFGLIMILVGLFLILFGIIQLLVARIRSRSK